MFSTVDSQDSSRPPHQKPQSNPFHRPVTAGLNTDLRVMRLLSCNRLATQMGLVDHETAAVKQAPERLALDRGAYTFGHWIIQKPMDVSLGCLTCLYLKIAYD